MNGTISYIVSKISDISNIVILLKKFQEYLDSIYADSYQLRPKYYNKISLNDISSNIDTMTTSIINKVYKQGPFNIVMKTI